MNNVIGARAPAWLRIVAALAVVWNCVGVYAYLATVGVVKGGEGMTMAQMPAWVTGAFAISVFGGLLGSLGLVLLMQCKAIKRKMELGKQLLSNKKPNS